MKKFSLALLGMFLYLNSPAKAHEGEQKTTAVKKPIVPKKAGKFLRKASFSPKRSMSPWRQGSCSPAKKGHKQVKQVKKSMSPKRRHVQNNKHNKKGRKGSRSNSRSCSRSMSRSLSRSCSRSISRSCSRSNTPVKKNKQYVKKNKKHQSNSPVRKNHRKGSNGPAKRKQMKSRSASRSASRSCSRSASRSHSRSMSRSMSRSCSRSNSIKHRQRQMPIKGKPGMKPHFKKY